MREKKARFHKWADKKLKTDTSYLLSGGLWLGINRSAAVISGIALSIAFANLLPKDVFGTYQFILSLASICGAFTFTGMRIVVKRAAARGNENALAEGFRTHLKWSIGIALTAFAGALYYFVNENNTLAVSLLIVGSLAPFRESFRLYSSFLSGRGEFKKLVTLGFFRKILPTASLLLVLLVTDNPVLLVLTYFVSNTIAVGSIYLKVRRAYHGDEPLEKTALQYGKHISAIQILGMIAGNIDKILVFHYLGAAQLAIYAFALLLPRHLRSFHQILNPLVFRKVSTMSIPALKRAMPHKAKLVFIGSIIIASAYIVTAPFIYGLLFPQYTDAVLFSQVLALGILFSPAALYKPVFGAHLKTRQSYAMQTIVPMIRITSFALLIPFFGLWGAIAALLVTQAVNFFLSFFLFRRLKE
ncbi:MAG: oligosaccharide flippase family protein [Candidatus Paceibacterota bacterium]